MTDDADLYDHNVFCSPEKLDLELVETLEEDGLCYAYNTFIVVKHVPTGRLFYAEDSGCSCPTPFEEYKFKGPDDTDMAEVKLGHKLEEFEKRLLDWGSGAGIGIDELDDVVQKMKKELKK